MGEDSVGFSQYTVYLLGDSGQRQGQRAASLFTSYTLYAQRKSVYHSKLFSISVVTADIYWQKKLLCKNVNS